MVRGRCLDEPGLLEGLLASAQLDGLTHCLNYTAIRHELDRKIRRAERHQLSEDRLGRYGGGEFVSIFPETDDAAAIGLAERVRCAVSESVTDTLDGRVDASIGVAEWSPGVTAEDLLDPPLRR